MCITFLFEKNKANFKFGKQLFLQGYYNNPQEVVMLESEIWQQLKIKLKKDAFIDPDVFNTYVKNATFIQESETGFALVVATSLGVKLVEPWLIRINEVLKEIIKQPTTLYPVANSVYSEREKKSFKKEPKIRQLNDNFNQSFTEFVTGQSNIQSFKAARAVVENPGKWSPLFIYGPSGVGKTHLLGAINYEFKNQSPQLKVLYLSSDAFAKKVIDSLQLGHDAIENLKDTIRAYDALLIDDIQFLAKKEKTNEILFAIFNNFLESGKQLVFSSDKTPDQLNGFESRLITRFNLGLTVPIRLLDYETALAVTEKEFELQGLNKRVNYEVKRYVAKYFGEDVRKIKGTITRINFWILTNNLKTTITMKDIQDLFKDAPAELSTKEVSVKRIKELIGAKYGVSVKAMESKQRFAKVTTARHVAMFLTKDILGDSLNKIGKQFGGRDHSTVLKGIRKIEQHVKTDKNFKKQLEMIKLKIFPNN